MTELSEVQMKEKGGGLYALSSSVETASKHVSAGKYIGGSVI